mmetsp:Transcript_36610/g.40417  ORF Transcript_36610/g.40417 Transcript_36610/m.40417 type:complete len:434 (+) Transcript_36610:96-1397(+)
MNDSKNNSSEKNLELWQLLEQSKSRVEKSLSVLLLDIRAEDCDASDDEDSHDDEDNYDDDDEDEDKYDDEDEDCVDEDDDEEEEGKKNDNDNDGRIDGNNKEEEEDDFRIKRLSKRKADKNRSSLSMLLYESNKRLDYVGRNGLVRNSIMRSSIMKATIEENKVSSRDLLGSISVSKKMQKALSQSLESEIERYNQEERELLIAMVAAGEAAQEDEVNFTSETIDKEMIEEELTEAGGMDAIVEALCQQAVKMKQTEKEDERIEKEDEQTEKEDNEVVYEDSFVLLTTVALTLKSYHNYDTHKTSDTKNSATEDNSCNDKAIPLETIERVWLGTSKDLGLNYFNKSKRGLCTSNNIHWAACDNRLYNDDKFNFVVLCKDDNEGDKKTEKVRHGFTVEDPEPVTKALLKYIDFRRFLFENARTKLVNHVANEKK